MGEGRIPFLQIGRAARGSPGCLWALVSFTCCSRYTPLPRFLIFRLLNTHLLNTRLYRLHSFFSISRAHAWYTTGVLLAISHTTVAKNTRLENAGTGLDGSQGSPHIRHSNGRFLHRTSILSGGEDVGYFSHCVANAIYLARFCSNRWPL